MKKWFKLFYAILKDENGWVWPAVATAASSILGSTLSNKGTQSEEVYDPYSGLRGDWQDWLKKKLGTRTSYSQNPAFSLTQPDVEKATESTILGKLNAPYSAADPKAALEASKTQQIAREKERAATQQTEESNMYNRLGLVSSSPWLNRAGEMGEESLMRQGNIETGMDIYGLEYGLKADQLADEIARGWTGLGTVLGEQQTGREKWSQQMSETDLQRMINEEMGYGSMAGSVLGSNPPQRTTTTAGDDIWSTLGGIGTNVGTKMLLKALGLGA